MNTATLTAEQQNEVAALLKGFDTITAEMQDMAIRLVTQKAVKSQNDEQITTIERITPCPKGHRVMQIISLDFDDQGNYIKNSKGHVAGHACCSKCEEDFYNYFRLTNND